VSKPTQPTLPSDTSVVPKAWYAIAWSSECKEKPIKRKVANIDFVLFRNKEGQIQAVQAYCSHRGADLSTGKVINGCVQCPYHGWEFSGDGRCRKIPAHPERDIPDFAHIQSFPVQEKAGMIWIYPDSSTKAPDLHLFPILEEPQFVYSPYQMVWKAHLTRVVESVLDVAHLAFVHKQTIGKGLSPEINDLSFQAEKDDIHFQKGTNRFHYRFPTQWIQYLGKNETKMFTFATFTPLDHETTVIFSQIGRTFAKRVPFIGKYLSHFGLRVLKEDQLIVEGQHPRPIPEALRMEAHVPSDGVQVRFRHRWYQFLKNETEHLLVRGSE
jgi:phenylpropionate dioxygenase-like ring-hydroxylating dioxygenase large terminal subunit